MEISETYMSIKNRNARAKELRAQGYTPRIYSVRGQLMHPHYIKDYESVAGHTLTAEDNGFGNCLYKTFFKSIYIVEA